MHLAGGQPQVLQGSLLLLDPLLGTSQMEHQTSFHCAYHQTGKACFSQFGHLVLSVFSNHIVPDQVLFLSLHLVVPAEVSLTPSSSISEDVLELTHLLLAVAKRILQYRRSTSLPSCALEKQEQQRELEVKRKICKLTMDRKYTGKICKLTMDRRQEIYQEDL